MSDPATCILPLARGRRRLRVEVHRHHLPSYLAFEREPHAMHTHSNLMLLYYMLMPSSKLNYSYNSKEMIQAVVADSV